MKFLRKLKWILFALITFFSRWVLLLLSPYFALIANSIIILFVAKCSYYEIINRFEIINSVFMINIATLANIIFISSKDNDKETCRKWSVLFYTISIAFSVLLTIELERPILSVDKSVFFILMVILSILTIFMVIIKSEKQETISDFVAQQEKAFESKKKKQATYSNGNLSI